MWRRSDLPAIGVIVVRIEQFNIGDRYEKNLPVLVLFYRRLYFERPTANVVIRHSSDVFADVNVPPMAWFEQKRLAKISDWDIVRTIFVCWYRWASVHALLSVATARHDAISAFNISRIESFPLS
jgi:hypothetical protein